MIRTAMARIRRELSVACTPQAAFDFLVDGRNEARWNPANRTEQATEGPIGVGTDFRFTREMMGGRSGVYRVTEYDRPLRFTHSTVSGNLPMRFEAHHFFEPVGDKTRITWEFEVRPRGPLRLMAPLMARMVGRSLDRFLPRVKSILESAGRTTESRPR
jgi:carbon monoxide dehydrogenase subunit G